MLLTELFDTKINYNVTANSAVRFSTSAMINNREIVFRADIDNAGRVGVEANIVFGETVKDHRNELKMTFKLTGSGGEMKVFSMIGLSLRELVDRYQPDMIMFSADKEGGGSTKRADVYEKLVNKFIPEYEPTRKDVGDSILFDLYKK